MSYIPESQEIKKPIKETLECLERLADAIDFRLEDQERWSSSHLFELKEFRKELVDWQFKLRELDK